MKRLQDDYACVGDSGLLPGQELTNPDSLQYLERRYGELVDEVVRNCLPAHSRHRFYVVLLKGSPKTSNAQLVRISAKKSVIKISLFLISKFHQDSKEFFKFIVQSDMDPVSKSPFLTWMSQQSGDAHYVNNVAELLFLKSAIACVFGHEAGHVLSGQAPLPLDKSLPAQPFHGREIGADGYGVDAGISVFQKECADSLSIPELHRMASLASKSGRLTAERLERVLSFDLAVAQYAVVLASFAAISWPDVSESWTCDGGHPADSFRLLAAAVGAMRRAHSPAEGDVDTKDEGLASVTQSVVEGLLLVLGFCAFREANPENRNRTREESVTRLTSLLNMYDADPTFTTNMRNAYLEYLDASSQPDGPP